MVVDPNGGVVVDGFEVENRFGICCGLVFEAALIPECVFWSDAFFDAGESRFDGEGDEDLSDPLSGSSGCLISDGVVPESVEVGPLIADELWAWVFLPSVGGGDLAGPFGGD